MINVIAWLIGSKTGLYVSVAGIALAIVFIVAWRLWAYGRASLRAEIAVEGMKRLQNAIKEKDRISGMSADERRRFVSRFLRPD